MQNIRENHQTLLKNNEDINTFKLLWKCSNYPSINPYIKCNSYQIVSDLSFSSQDLPGEPKTYVGKKRAQNNQATFDEVGRLALPDLRSPYEATIRGLSVRTCYPSHQEVEASPLL